MPLYDYACDRCGPFSDWRPMREAADPADCPGCGGTAPRMVSAPFVARMNPHDRVAHQRNEKSAHEPGVVRKKTHDRDPDAHPHRHGGHAHGLGHSHGRGRPWMIGH